MCEKLRTIIDNTALFFTLPTPIQSYVTHVTNTTPLCNYLSQIINLNRIFKRHTSRTCNFFVHTMRYDHLSTSPLFLPPCTYPPKIISNYHRKCSKYTLSNSPHHNPTLTAQSFPEIQASIIFRVNMLR